jgi:DNA polymerase III subunit delta
VSPAPDPVAALLAAAGEPSPLYLIAGDLVLAEAAAGRLAQGLARRAGADLQVRRRPSDLPALLHDLRTFSLFGAAKVVVAVDTAVLGDRKAAAELVAEAVSAAPRSAGEPLGAAQREAASRLLQALHLFGIEPHEGSCASVLDRLPDWALTGGKSARKQAAERREQLTPLLEVARQEGLQGIGHGGVSQLAEALQRGLPRGHSLVLAERSVAADHPLVEQLRRRGAVLEVGRVSSQRGEWAGAEELAAQLASELGVAIRPDALRELAARTLRQQEGRGSTEASASSTSRFAGEYRKLSHLSAGAAITRELVVAAVEDRGEQDVWQLLDALAEGRAGIAVAGLERLLASAEDPLAARFSFFALLASFCRQLVAVHGAVERLGLPRAERSYPRFRERLAPALVGALPEGWASPLAGLHPFRLHRAYLAVSAASGGRLARLPWRVLETELALKGESAEPRAALAALLAEVAAALRPAARSPHA